jgi:hypothetical protein
METRVTTKKSKVDQTTTEVYLKKKKIGSSNKEYRVA